MNKNKFILVFVSITILNLNSKNANANSLAISMRSSLLGSGIESDPFIGKFKGLLFGVNVQLVIDKKSEGNYDVYVNGIGPDKAILSNGELSGFSDGLSFSLRISNWNLVLRMFDQDLLFEREDEVASGYTTPLETLNNKHVANNSNIDPFVGKFNGSGVDNTSINLQITKGQSEGEYQLYFNGLGPQSAIKNGQFITIAENGVEFNFEAIPEGLILTANGRSIQLARINPSSSQESTGSSQSQPIVNNKDIFVGNYDLIFWNEVLTEVSIQNSIGDQYFLNSPNGGIMDLVKNSNSKLIGEGGKIVISDNILLFYYKDKKMRLTNKRPYKFIPKIELKIDQRLLGGWLGYLSGGYGGSSSSEKYIFFNDDESFSEKSNSTSGGYNGGYSSLGGEEKGNYQIIEQTTSGGKIKIFGRELEYILSDNDKKLFLYGVNYYRQ